MSTISTPLPSSFDKRPLAIGLGVAGLVVAGVVVAQNVSLPSTTGSTTTTVTDTRAGGPDAIEARQRSAEVRAGGPDAIGARARAEATRIERQLDASAKSQGNYSGASANSSSYRVGGSTWLSQVPTVAAAGAVAVPASVVAQQVGGEHLTYDYSPSGTHLVWNDVHVPPYENPEWKPLIQKHYFGARAGE